MSANNKEIQLPLLKNVPKVNLQNDQNDFPYQILQQRHQKSPFMDYVTHALPSEKYIQKIPFFQRMMFFDIFPIIKRINSMSKEFEISDTPLLEKGMNIEAKLITLDKYWTQELHRKSEPSFSNALYRTFIPEIMLSLGHLLVDCTCRLCYTLFMGKMILMMSKNSFGEEQEEEVFDSALILSVLMFVSFLFKNWAFHIPFSQGARARLTISGLLYKKIHSVSITSLNEIKISKVINLIANDLNDIETNAPFLPNLVLGPYMLVLGTFIMWQYFGGACLVGILSMAAFLFAQIFISKRTETPRKENKLNTDSRVKFTHEFIECIRLIKMYTWEKPFKKIIKNIRQEEYTTFMKIASIDAFGRNFSHLSTYFSILLICIVYIQLGGILSPDKVYASMGILIFLGNYCILFSHIARMFLINFRIILKRVQEILMIKDVLVLEETIQSKNPKSLGYLGAKPTSIEFKDFTAYWNRDSKKPCLANINLKLKQGTLTTIIGKIGSGKTSFLLSFLREIPITEGSFNYSGRIAYVEQEPIIFSGTFRENILFGKPYREDFYLKIIKASNLDSDLSLFDHGDLTLIGERGVTLSGGQRARVSLARAIYSESDIYLFDDLFAAVDSRVAHSIFSQVFRSDLLRNKLAILVTHHLNFAKESDYILLMNEGKIEAQGTYQEIEKIIANIFNFLQTEHQKSSSISDKDADKDNKYNQTGKNFALKNEEQGMKEGITPVSWKTYRSYLNILGNSKGFCIYLSLLVLSEILLVSFNRFIGYWALQHSNFCKQNSDCQRENDFDHGYYITCCLLLLTLIPILNYLQQAQINRFLLSTNTKLHNKILNSLTKSKTVFFDLNPLGQVLNRFSNDLGILDKTNLVGVAILMTGVVEVLSLVITVCIINPFVLIPAVVTIIALFKVQFFFSKSKILAKNLELTTRSPLVSTVSSTLHGLITIRAYQQGGKFIHEFMDMLYDSSRTFLFLSKLNRSLSVSLDLGVNALSVISILIFAFTIVYYPLEAGLVGLSLFSILRFGDKTNFIIRQTTNVDINMQSAQRMLDYCSLPSEAPYYIPSTDKFIEQQTQSKWPRRGDIIFRNVYLKYREDLKFVLNGLTFEIQGGTKVAVVGRTGAGKSSIIQALFRMTEIQDGPDYFDSFIKIDSVDTKSIGLNLLRKKISIIPQTPVVFSGTIRRNLDPFETFTDTQLWYALEEVGLKTYILSLEKQLNTDMTVSSSIFSAGQKQLMCLARAILTKNKIIVLDEATANVDIDTDNFIQRKISEKFSDCTVITIAHRLMTIAHYDKVIVMDRGVLVEHDSPYLLLVEKCGDFHITKKDGVFVAMVKGTGGEMSQRIFEISRGSYFKKTTNSN